MYLIFSLGFSGEQKLSHHHRSM